MKIGFDNEKYLKIQSEHIKERISQFDGKLYLELGGKLFDDHHASRVLPGFQPDSKLRMFQKISDSIEIVIVISAADIEKHKIYNSPCRSYRTDECVIGWREPRYSHPAHVQLPILLHGYRDLYQSFP